MSGRKSITLAERNTYEMLPNTFKIFEKKKGFNLSTENVIAIILVGLFFGFVYLKEKVDSTSINQLSIVLAIMLCVWLISLMTANFFRYEKEFGEYNSEIVLFKDRIETKGNVYFLFQILSIDLQSGDTKGDFANFTYEFAPRLSNGLNNKISISVKNWASF